MKTFNQREKYSDNQNSLVAFDTISVQGQNREFCRFPFSYYSQKIQI
jgi:hypothetical protein